MEAALEVGREDVGVCGAGRLDWREARDRCREGVEGGCAAVELVSDARLY